MAGQPGSRIDVRWVALGVAATGLGAIALASRGSGIFGHLENGTSPLGPTIARAVLGLLAGVAAGFGAAALLRATNHRHRFIDGGQGRPTWRRALLWSVPLIVLLGGLGAAAAASTTKLHPRDQGTTTQTRPGSGGGIASGQPNTASYVDLNHDGRPDVGPDGEPVMLADLDGDGRFESVLVRCPDTRDGPPGGRQPIDLNCNGTIDRTIRIQGSMITSVDRGVPRNGDGTLDIESIVNGRGSPGSGSTGGGGSGGTGGSSSGSNGSGDGSINRSPDLANTVRLIAIVLLAAGLVGLIVLIVKSIRGGQRIEAPEALADLPAPPGDVDHAAAASTLADTIDAISAEPDPRRAILAAYATLLDGLAAAGLPRLAHEAPAEHLERCLAALAVRPAPMRSLVDVFLLARFSSHPVGEAHREQALVALHAAQDDLASIRVPAGASGG